MATCPTCRKRFADSVTSCPNDGETLLPNEAFTGVDVDLVEGQVVGEYRVEKKIGEGGFGSVYRAVHPLIGKAAAIKVLNRQYSSNPQMVSRFISEARAVNQIRHRNIIDIFSFGSLEDGRQYFVMELLEGMPLDAYLKQKGHIPIEEAVPVLRAVARALDAAHANGIAHRDLKPENVFLVFDDDGGTFPKLLDFGIAKLLQSEASTGPGAAGPRTRTGTPMGTPYYMSPEQCRGKNVDHRTDIYSFGVMCHELLTGALPFQGDDLMDLLIKQTTAPAPPMSSTRPDLPATLDAPVLKMLEKDPAARPATLGSAVDELARAAREAGFDVALGSPKGAGGRFSAVVGADGRASLSTPGPGSRSSPEAIQLAEARTMHAGPGSSPSLGSVPGAVPSQPSMHTMGGAELATGTRSTSPATKSRLPLFLGLGGVFAVAGAIGAVVLVLGSKGAPRADATGTSTGPTAPVVSAAASAGTGTGMNAGGVERLAASTEAPVKTSVDVRVQTTPEHATIWLGKEKLGDAPGPVTLPRGSEKVTLTVKADGYKSADVEVVPTDNATIANVKLGKLGVLGAGGGSGKPNKPPTGASGEIENPFK